MNTETDAGPVVALPALTEQAPIASSSVEAVSSTTLPIVTSAPTPGASPQPDPQLPLEPAAAPPTPGAVQTATLSAAPVAIASALPADTATPPAAEIKPSLVRMVTTAMFANPKTNSGKPDGQVAEGETITVDPFYAEDLRVGGLARAESQEDLEAALKEAGERPDVHARGVRITRKKG